MLSKYSVKRPYTVLVAVAIAIILGVVSLTRMTVDLLPSMDFNYAYVMTTYIGASPEEVEEEVTRPIEQAMATVSNIKNVSSTSAENYSSVILEFEQTANMDSITVEMREKLDQISGDWGDTVSNPIIMKVNMDMMPIMVSAVSVSDADAVEATNTIEKDVIPELESLEGVATVDVYGNVTQTINVSLSEDKINALNENVKTALDAKFREAENAIAQAKSQVEAGRQALESGQEQATDGLSEAEVQMAQGNTQIIQGLLEINSKQQELNLAKIALNVQLTASQQLDDQESAINTAVANKETIDQEYQALQQQIAAETAAGNQPTEEEMSRLAELTQLEYYINNADALLATIAQSRQSIGGTTDELNAQMAQMTEAEGTLASMKSQLESGAMTLDDARGQLTTAQMQAISQMTEGATQLAVGDAAIAQQEAQLAAGKQEAYASASLDTLLSTDTLKGMLTAENFSMPAGYVTEDGARYLVRVGNRFGDLAEMRDLVLIDMDGIDPIHLTDVAEVTTEDNSDSMYAKINGEQGILLQIQKQSGYSTGDVSDRILDKLNEIQKEKKGIHYATLMDQGVYIDMILSSVLQNMLFGGILAILVLLLFLRSYRPTLIIACSIPLSIVTAVVLMYFTGVTLNVISLSGLALGVGMLVDNSIVVIENIYRMRGEGYSAREAAVQGARQVAGAIAASTLTTICVFAPIVFTTGITRQLFVDMGLTIAYSLLASLAVALTLVPMMAAGLLKKREKKETKLFTFLKEGYGKLLSRALRIKVLVLLLALVLFVGSAALCLSRGASYMPDMESTQMSVTMTGTEEDQLSDLAKKADTAMARIRKIKDVEDIGGMSITSDGDSYSDSQITMYAVLSENKKLTNEQIKKQIEKDTADLDCEVEVQTSMMDMSALGGSGVSVEIKGKDLDKLQELATQVAGEIGKVKGVDEVDNGLGETTGELRVIVDKDKAAAQNLMVAQVYQALAKKIATVTSSTTLYTDDYDYDVYVVNAKDAAMSREDIKNMTISATGLDGSEKEVPLSEIASFEDRETMTSIARNEQSREITVSATVADGDNITLVSNRVRDALKKVDMPSGYTAEMTGEDTAIIEAMKQIGQMLGLAIILMYLIMVAQFQSLKSPFIIMFTIPLAFTGGFLGLYLTGSVMSVIGAIGFVVLSGIIVNNGIVFIDYTNQLIEGGMERREALVKAGKTRLRPIIMTALTTILGLSTMALGLGMGADMVQPMAVVTIGGLIYGTILTLFVVPCIYDLFHRKRGNREMESEDLIYVEDLEEDDEEKG